MEICAAIEMIKNEKECVINATDCNRDCGKCALLKDSADILNAYNVAISAMEKLQQIKSRQNLHEEKMTLDEAIKHCEEVINSSCTSCGEQHRQLQEWLIELQQYRQSGSVEECREAMERQQARKPIAGEKIGEYICCPYCGQVIDWSNAE